MSDTTVNTLPPGGAEQLARLQAELADRDLMIRALQDELDETNRGVVVLYAELDDQAEQLRRASERSESKFQAIYAQAPNGIALLDDSGRIIDANPALAKLLTMVDASVLGHRLSEYVADDHAAIVATFSASPSEAPRTREVPIKRPDGSQSHVEWSITAQVEPGVTMVIGTDVSQRVELERTRLQWLERERAARGDAEHGSRMKDDFIAVLAHELRTPLNAIMGWTQVLRKRGGTDEAMRGVAAIERNCTTQARMISDLLDMSRLNMGKLAMSFEKVDPLREVTAAIDAMRTTIEQKAIVVDMHANAEYRAVRADASRLQQVIWNLVSNAIKFSPHGGRVAISLAEDDMGLGIRVQDHGQGIDPAFLPFVFERFAQSDTASNLHRGGLGLGLAIVKQIVEAHGGTIGAHSDGPGMGAVFEVWLPIDRHPVDDAVAGPAGAPGEGPQDEGDHPLAGLKLLIVDDDQDTLAMLRIVLSDRGANVMSASSVEEALASIEANVFDLLISDIGMPLHDGYELLRRQRLAERGRPVRLPALALTSFTRDVDKEQALRAGFDAHCSKPIKPMALIREITRLLGRHTTSR